MEGGGTLTLIITLRERRIEEFRIRFGNKVACWSNFRCSLSRGEFTTVAMRRKLLQPQCSSGCKEKSFVAGCTSVLLHFFLSPSPYNPDSYAIVHRDGQTTLPTRQWAISPRVSYRRVPEKDKRYIYIYILLRFWYNFFDFYIRIKSIR